MKTRSMVVGVLALAMSAVASAEVWEGDYRFEGDFEQGQRSIKKAIDDGTEEMSWITRGVARGRLEKKNELPKTISFDRQGDHITVTFDGDRVYTTPADGTRVQVTLPDDEKVEVSQRLQGNVLTQTFYSNDGQRENKFTFAPTGDVVQMKVTNQSKKLPAPVVYQVRFDKVD